MIDSEEPFARYPRIRIAARFCVGLAVAGLAPTAALAAGRVNEFQVAYLDPGTGSLILQAIVATIAGAAVAITTYWRKIRKLFRRGSQDSEPSDNARSDG